MAGEAPEFQLPGLARRAMSGVMRGHGTAGAGRCGRIGQDGRGPRGPARDRAGPLPGALARAATRRLTGFGPLDELTAEFFRHRPRPGAAWLVLVDGLDEIPDADARGAAPRMVAGAAADEPKLYRSLPAGRTGVYRAFAELLYEQNAHQHVADTHAAAIHRLKDRHQVPKDRGTTEAAARRVADHLPQLIDQPAHERINGNTAPAVVVPPHARGRGAPPKVAAERPAGRGGGGPGHRARSAHAFRRGVPGHRPVGRGRRPGRDPRRHPGSGGRIRHLRDPRGVRHARGREERHARAPEAHLPPHPGITSGKLADMSTATHRSP